MNFLKCTYRILFDVFSVISIIVAVGGVFDGIKDMIGQW